MYLYLLNKNVFNEDAIYACILSQYYAIFDLWPNHDYDNMFAIEFIISDIKCCFC